MRTTARQRRRRLGSERREDLDHQRQSVADVAVVWARAEDGIRGFLVESGTPGYTTSDIHGKLSMRASVTSSLSFSDCRDSRRRIACPARKGLKAALACLTQARYGIGWGVIGAAMDCYETARQYTVLRKQFDDRPIASHQLVQEKLAWMITEITKAQLLALHAGRLKDQGKLEPAHVSMLKRNNVAMALGLRAHQPRPAGRQRHHRRVSDHAPHVQSGNREDLRRHGSYSCAGHRGAGYRHRGIQVVRIHASLRDHHSGQRVSAFPDPAAHCQDHSSLVWRSAAVWTTCLLFFQVVLLLGYFYAHLLNRLGEAENTGADPLRAVVGSLVLLPVLPDPGWKPSGAEDPVPAHSGAACGHGGLTVFSPFRYGASVQAWYARGYQGALPYWLYALSNAGSMLALLSTPSCRTVYRHRRAGSGLVRGIRTIRGPLRQRRAGFA